MNQEKFQTMAIVFLVLAVNVLMLMLWQQKTAINNLTEAVNTLSTTSAGARSPAAVPAPAPAP